MSAHYRDKAPACGTEATKSGILWNTDSEETTDTSPTFSPEIPRPALSNINMWNADCKCDPYVHFKSVSNHIKRQKET